MNIKILENFDNVRSSTLIIENILKCTNRNTKIILPVILENLSYMYLTCRKSL